jgi:hypothetical protein
MLYYGSVHHSSFQSRRPWLLTANVRLFCTASLHISKISGRRSQFSAVARSILGVVLVRSEMVAAILGKMADTGFSILEDRSAMIF